MLAIILTKLLLKGAIKTFIVNPILSSTFTVVPEKSIISAHLLGFDTMFSSSDLLKFGIEKLYERYLEKQLDFKIEKLSRYVYGIAPASELAELFTKDYYTEEELVVDLTKFEEFIDQLLDTVDNSLIGEQVTESELEEVMNHISQDLDLALIKSENNLFDNPANENKLIDEILEKNLLELEKEGQLLPGVPDPKDEEEIDEVLRRIAASG